MKLNGAAFSTSYDAEVKGRIHALELTFYKATGGGTDSTAIIAALEDAATTLEITKNTAQGTETKVYKQLLIDLLEVSISEGGSIRAYIDGANYVLEGTFVLSGKGAEALHNNDFYKISIKALPDGVTGDAWALDVTTDAISQFQYNPMRITAGAPQYTSVANAKYLAIPREEFSSIDVFYKDGSRVNYDAFELSKITAGGMPLAFIVDGKIVSGGRNYYVMPVGPAQKVQIDVTADCAVIIVNEHSL